MYVVSPFLYSGIILSSIFSIYGELCDKIAVVPCLGTAAFLTDGIMRGSLWVVISPIMRLLNDKEAVWGYLISSRKSLIQKL